MADSYNGEQMAEDFDVDVNWDEVGNPPPAHKFNVVCEKAEYKRSSTNRHMIKAQFKIEGYDPAHPDDEKFVGRTIFCNFNFSAEGGFLTKAYYAITGIPLPRTINQVILEEECGKLLEQHVCVTLKHRVYNEQKQADISKFDAPMEVGTRLGETIDETGMGDENQPDPDADLVETEAAADEEPPPPPEPAPRPTSLRAAAAAAQSKKNGNGAHANGTNGGARPAAAARPAAKPPAPAAKTSKPQPRR